LAAGGSLDSNLTLTTGLKIYGDFTAGNDATNVFHVDNWHTTNSPATYVGFIVSAVAGFVLDLGDGDGTFSTKVHQHPPGDTSMFNTVTLVVNGITIGSQGYTPAGGSQSLNWSMGNNVSLNGLSTADFRLYFTGTSNPAQSNRGPEWSVVDGATMSFAGSIFSVPEPSRAILLFAGLGVVMIRRRRQSACS
jgi:hypothetical protein